MKVSRDEIIRTRKILLRVMDSFIRENIDEDVVIDVWLTCGLEDGWDDDILTEYASDDDSWNDCVKAFQKCCNYKIREIDKFKECYYNIFTKLKER